MRYLPCHTSLLSVYFLSCLDPVLSLGVIGTPKVVRTSHQHIHVSTSARRQIISRAPSSFVRSHSGKSVHSRHPHPHPYPHCPQRNHRSCLYLLFEESNDDLINVIGKKDEKNIMNNGTGRKDNRNSNEEEKNDDDGEDGKKMEMEHEKENKGPLELKLKQKAEVLLYRLTMISSAVAFSTEQITNLFLAGSGSGLSPDTIASLQYNSHAIGVWGILFASLLAPPNLDAITDKNEENDVKNVFFLLLNELLPTMASFAIVVEIVNTISANLSQGTDNFIPASSASLDNISLFFVCAISLREICFYGAAYKAEAIIAIVLSVVLGLNDAIGFSEVTLTGGIALCLLVLAGGKVFEPIADDVTPNGSAFFKDNI